MEASPLTLWNQAIKRYGVLRELEAQFTQASERGENADRAQQLRDEATALAEAVYALQRLGANPRRREWAGWDIDYDFTGLLLAGSYCCALPLEAA